MSGNFNGAAAAGLPIAVTTDSNPFSLGSDKGRVQSAPDVLIDNRGTSDCYIRFGASDVVVDVATGLRVPAKAMVIYSKGTATHIAAIGDQTTSLVVHLGEGQ